MLASLLTLYIWSFIYSAKLTTSRSYHCILCDNFVSQREIFDSVGFLNADSLQVEEVSGHGCIVHQADVLPCCWRSKCNHNMYIGRRRQTLIQIKTDNWKSIQNCNYFMHFKNTVARLCSLTYFILVYCFSCSTL